LLKVNNHWHAVGTYFLRVFFPIETKLFHQSWISFASCLFEPYSFSVTHFSTSLYFLSLILPSKQQRWLGTILLIHSGSTALQTKSYFFEGHKRSIYPYPRMETTPYKNSITC